MEKQLLTIWLGRHATSGSGMWVYLENLIPHLVNRLHEYGWRTELLGAGPAALEEILLTQLNHHSAETSLQWLTDPYGSRYLGNLRDILFLGNFPGILHGMSNSLPLFGQASKKIITMHDLLQAYPHTPPRKFFPFIKTSLYRRYFGALLNGVVDHIVTGHPKTVTELKHRYSCDSLSVVYPPLSHEFCEELPSPLPEKEDYILTFVSQDERKNFARTFGAFERLPESMRLKVVISSPALLPRVEAIVKKSVKRDLVIPVINPSRLALRELYRRAQVTAFPSLAEGFGYPIYESISQGTPVLTAHDLTIPELEPLKDFITGCNPTSMDDISRGLDQAVNLSPSQEELLYGSRLVQATLHPQRCAEAMVKTYFAVAKFSPFCERGGVTSTENTHGKLNL